MPALRNSTVKPKQPVGDASGVTPGQPQEMGMGVPAVGGSQPNPTVPVPGVQKRMLPVGPLGQGGGNPLAPGSGGMPADLSGHGDGSFPIGDPGELGPPALPTGKGNPIFQPPLPVGTGGIKPPPAGPVGPPASVGPKQTPYPDGSTVTEYGPGQQFPTLRQPGRKPVQQQLLPQEFLPILMSMFKRGL